MHLETLLYMLLQSDKVLPPSGINPDFKALAEEVKIKAVPNQWIKIPERAITIGMNDPESSEGPDRYFGWDCEKPQRTVTVPAFDAKAHGITNGDYARYLEEAHIDAYPASWTIGTKSSTTTNDISNGVTNGNTDEPSTAFLKGKAVKTIFGPIPLSLALDWPVMASYNELEGCAKWMNGRIPTMEETRSIYTYVDDINAKETGDGVSSATIPAVNG